MSRRLAKRARAVVVIGVVTLALMTSTSASATPSSVAKGKGIPPDTVCFLCGAWVGLCVVLCPLTRPCASPLFEVIACTGGECFKGFDDGDCLSGFGSEANPDKPKDEVAPPDQNRDSPPSSPGTQPPGSDRDDDDDNAPDRPPIDVRPVPTSSMRY